MYNLQLYARMDRIIYSLAEKIKFISISYSKSKNHLIAVCDDKPRLHKIKKIWLIIY